MNKSGGITTKIAVDYYFNLRFSTHHRSSYECSVYKGCSAEVDELTNRPHSLSEPGISHQRMNCNRSLD